MAVSLRLLVVEDEEVDFVLLEDHLRREGEAQNMSFSCLRVANREELAGALEAAEWDVVLADYRLAGMDFGQAFSMIRVVRPDLPIIIVSGTLGEEEGVEWLKRGVADFVIKNRLGRLVPAIDRARREAAERRSRLRVVEALRRSRGLLRLITDAAPVLISYIDTDLRYRLANRAYQRWFGLTPQEIVGRPVRDIIGEAALAVVRPYMDRALAGEAISFEEELPYRTLGKRWVHVDYIPDTETGGRVRGFAVLVQDISQRKEAELAQEAYKARLEEEVAARTAQLADSNRELQAFTYAVSHDLKAPLRGINAFSALLERRCRGCLDEEGLEFLDHIQRNVRRMNDLVDDLLAYAREDQSTRELAAVDLAAAVGAVVAERGEEISRQGAEVKVDLPAVMVLAEPEGLAQVLRNLVDNALKFSAESRPPIIAIGAEVVPGGCRLWVRDNGIGFDMAHHDRIFQIFQRLHSVSEFPGTGIGLALVRKAMERMGGKVWGESLPGQGATFFLLLQTAGEEREAGPAGEEAPRPAD